jgi:aminoglycoside phosphotransferase (APT) family kinase protein
MSAAELPINASALEAYLGGFLKDFRGPLTLCPFAGGQSNPTYRLETPGACYVLRRRPEGPLLPSAHAIDREFRVMAALGPTGFPVPRMIRYCADETVIGSAFYLMELIEGRHFWDPRLPEITRPDERGQLYRAMVDRLADLHDIDWRAIGLADFGKPGNYVGRQIARWSKQYQASTAERIPAMERLIDWLPNHLPAQETVALVHGDYRLDNLIFQRGKPKIAALLDWELSTLGDPLADLSYYAMVWRFSPALFRGLAGEGLAALGIPTEREILSRYLERRRLAPMAPEIWSFYMAYNMFRMAAILQGVDARARAGNAADAKGLEMGAKVQPIAALAWAEVQKAGA